MGGRGTSSRGIASRAKTSNGGLRYKGKVEATNYTGFAKRYLSKYEEATGKSDTVAYKVGHAYYKLNSAVRKLNRDNAKLHGIKPTKDREFSTYALSWLKDSGLKDYAEKTGDSEANLREIRNRKVRLAKELFYDGLEEMITRLHPTGILIWGQKIDYDFPPNVGVAYFKDNRIERVRKEHNGRKRSRFRQSTERSQWSELSWEDFYLKSKRVCRNSERQANTV